MTSTRRQAREWAIQMLTAADLNPPGDIAQFVAAQWEQICSLSAEDGTPVKVKSAMKRFAEERVIGVLSHLGKIDARITPLLENWDLYRLGTIERTVIRLGMWELAYSDVPVPVVINEAIDLANWFSTSRSRMLVNGVLDKFAKANPRAAAAE
ncbi:MAG: transcription antitermination factor NusB [Kiritimatiellae bacterium]|nr:transcription antitermination factor NusB [Kiritimatiellia bacterium]